MKREKQPKQTNEQRPKESTLMILRQFARCCKSETRLTLPLRIINLN
ncbi:MAG: hypothetical protein K2G09_04375 [Paramuribaculum sp.]|nr:hypothetical protein [Paramuribaculum sp.]